MRARRAYRGPLAARRRVALEAAHLRRQPAPPDVVADDVAAPASRFNARRASLRARALKMASSRADVWTRLLDQLGFRGDGEEMPLEDDLPDFIQAEEEQPIVAEEPVFTQQYQQEETASSSMADYIKMVDEDNQSTDPLQPGGVGSGVMSVNSTLESMSIKELRRLGQQKGISNANELKKKELIAAIRAIPVGMFDA